MVVTNPVGQLSIESLADQYVVSPVPYIRNVYRVRVGKKKLDYGFRKTYDEWVEYLEGRHIAGQQWRLPSVPLISNLLTTLYEGRNGNQKALVEEIKQH